MSTTAVDTLRLTPVLEAAGIEAHQAEPFVTTVRPAVAEGEANQAEIADAGVDIVDVRTNVLALLAKTAQVETRTMRTPLYAVAAALVAGQLAAVFALLRLLG